MPIHWSYTKELHNHLHPRPYIRTSNHLRLPLQLNAPAPCVPTKRTTRLHAPCCQWNRTTSYTPLLERMTSAHRCNNKLEHVHAQHQNSKPTPTLETPCVSTTNNKPMAAYLTEMFSGLQIYTGYTRTRSFTLELATTNVGFVNTSSREGQTMSKPSGGCPNHSKVLCCAWPLRTEAATHQRANCASTQ